jgi:SAM-dependent methyltransferase
MKMESFPTCMICGQTGRMKYKDLPDRLFGVPGRFQSRECPRCRLLWLDPRPSPESIAECYRAYYTHEALPTGGEQARPLADVRDRLREAILCGYFGYRHLHRDHHLCWCGGLWGRIPLLRYRAVYDDLGDRFPVFVNRKDNLLVDVGCGRGDFLGRMKTLGWNVLGIEPDPVSAALATRRGIPVFRGTLSEAALPDAMTDQVVMSHVLEHLYDPHSVINECYRILRPGGRLVIITPNNESLGHRIFNADWRGLEPPRHLFIYSGSSLRKILERRPFRMCQITTRSHLARGTYDYGLALRNAQTAVLRSAAQGKGRKIFGLIENLLCALGRPAGEEIVVTALKD